jgi:nitrate reductase gamma subunit
MATPTGQQDARAQAPIRWSRPEGTFLSATAVWLVGLVTALLVPAAIVPPSSVTAEPTKIWTAFAVSVVGAILLLGSTIFYYRRKGDSAVLILGLVPAFSTVVGGVIFATTMLSRR